MLIHAHARTKPHTVEFNGRKYKFSPNDEGHVVAEINDKPTVERLLLLSEGYRVYAVVRLEPEPEDTEVSPFVISIGGGDGSEATESLDLRTLTKAQLVAFAAENELKDIKPDLKVDDYRQAIVNALNSVE